MIGRRGERARQRGAVLRAVVRAARAPSRDRQAPSAPACPCSVKPTMLRRKSRPDCLIAAAAAAKSPPQLSSPSVMSTTDPPPAALQIGDRLQHGIHERRFAARLRGVDQFAAAPLRSIFCTGCTRCESVHVSFCFEP